MRVALVLASLLTGPAWLTAQEPLRPLGYGPLPRGAWACLGSPRFTGEATATCVAFSPDGKFLASGTGRWGGALGPTPAIHVWDLATGQELFTLRGHDQQIAALGFTPGGRKLISASADGSVKVWDLVRGAEERQLWGHESAVTGMDLTADGKLAVTCGSDGTVRVWEIATGKELRRLECPVRGISLAPGGRKLAVAAGDVLLWDIHTGEKPRRLGPANAPAVQGVRCSPDGKSLAVLTGDGQVALWDVATGAERLRLPKLQRPTLCLAFSHDGKVLATGGYGYNARLRFLGDRADLKVWDAGDGKELASCEDFTSDILAVAFSPDGGTLASAGDFTARLWDWKKGRELPRFTGHAQEITGLVYSPDGKTLYSASKDATVRVWDAGTTKEEAVLRGHAKGVMALGLTPDGKTLATASMDGSVRVWDTARRKELHRLTAEHGDAWCLAFAPAERILVSGDGGWTGPGGPPRVWDWWAAKELRQLKALPGARCLAFSPDGKTVAVGFQPNLTFIDVGTGRSWQQLTAHGNEVQGLAYLADGTVLTVGGDDQIHPKKKGGFRRRVSLPRLMTARLWDPKTGTRLYEFASAEGQHAALAVSPDGRLLAVAFERSIHVWETSTRAHVGEAQAHRGHVSALAFSPDGRTLASGGADGAILFWDLTGGRLKDGKLVGPALKPTDLDALWRGLGEEDGRRAVWALAAAPEQAVPFLRERLAAVGKSGPANVKQLVADLDAPKFAARQRAMIELEKLGPAAEPALRIVLENSPSPEVAKRVESLLEKLSGQGEKRVAAEVLRLLRAVESLERIATPEARAVLRGIAEGGALDRPTREAQAALKRLGL
jgi:WD40 repeat protein